jgi:hypothetical protein
MFTENSLFRTEQGISGAEQEFAFSLAMHKGSVPQKTKGENFEETTHIIVNIQPLVKLFL